MLKDYILNLRKFDEAAAAGGQSGESVSPAAGEKQGESKEVKVIYGKVTPPTNEPEKNPAASDKKVIAPDPEARKAEFERLIQGEYKDLFEERFQKVFDKRFKDYKTLQQQVAGFKPILDLLGSKYGIKDGDLNKLAQAIQEDTTLWEEEAIKQGLTVEQYKYMKKLEAENKAFREMQEQIEREKGAQETYNKWIDQANELKKLYPTFDLKAEINDPVTGQKFIDVLAATNDVSAAFHAVHFNEILPSAMQVTAQKVKEATVSDIQSRNQRPLENGTKSSTGVIVKSDPSKWTDEDIDEVIRRVQAGERIVL